MKSPKLLLLALTAATASLFCQEISAATALDHNLIVNGDAEASAGAQDLTSVQAPTGWTASGNFTAIKYNSTPSNQVGGNFSFLGNNHFFGGPNNALSSISQTIDISDRATEIDAGNLYAVLSGLFGGTSDHDSYISMRAEFFNDAQTSVGVKDLLGADQQERTGGAFNLVPAATSRLVPAGARTVKITLEAHSFSNPGYNHAAADNVSFKLIKDAQTVTVLGSANPFLSHADAGTSANCDTAPGVIPAPVIPTDVQGLVTQPNAQETFYFAASGGVEHGGSTPGNNPDGTSFFNSSSARGIAGVNAPLDALVGVFLNDHTLQPNETPPASLDFSPTGNVTGGVNYTDLSPVLGQVFFIGDGQTDTGVVQKIKAPNGATRLYLGTTDGCGWFNNTGAFSVLISKTPLVVLPPTTSYEDYNFTTLAGGTSGSADGTGSAAQFNQPRGLGVDHDGNVYIADSTNNTIRKVTQAGLVTTFAGTAGSVGSSDGQGVAATFRNPRGIAVDSHNNLFVTDTANHTIRKITPDATVSTFAGSAGITGSADGTGSDARFNNPQGIAVDGVDNIYLTDFSNHTIRKITPAGVVTTIAGSPGQSGTADGTGPAARFNFPAGVATIGSFVFVADTSNHTIRKIAPDGAVTTFAGLAGTSGTADGAPSAARFNNPRGLASDAAGNLFIADNFNHLIRKISRPTDTNSTPIVTTLGGFPGLAGFADGTGSAARFANPYGVAVDSHDNLYVIDLSNNALRVGVGPGTVSLLVNGSAQPTTVEPASPITFSATFTKATPSSALRVQVSLSNPTVESNWSDLPGGALTANGDGTYSLTTDNYPAGASVYFRVIASTGQHEVISNVVGPFVLQTTVGVELRLSLNAKTDIAPNGSNVIAGELITYTLTVRNVGTNIARNVVIIDRVPANTTFLAASPNATLDGSTVEFDLPSVPANGVRTLQLVVRANKDAPIGRAIVNGTTGIFADGVPIVAGQEKPDTVVKSPVDVELTSNASTVDPGGMITYTFTVKNLFNKPAKGVRLELPLPTNVQFVSAGGGAVNAGSVFFNLGTLTPNESRTLTLTVQLAFDAPASSPVVLGSPRVTTDTGGGPVTFALNNVTTNVSVATPAPPELSLTKFVPDGITIQQILAGAQNSGDQVLINSLKKVFPLLTSAKSIEAISEAVNPDISDTNDVNGNFLQGVIAPNQPNGPKQTFITFALIYGNRTDVTASNASIQDRVPEGTEYVANSVLFDGFKPFTGTLKIAPDKRTLTFQLGNLNKGYHLLTYRVRVLARNEGGLLPGARIQARGSFLRTSSLLHDFSGYPEQTDVVLVNPGNAFVESYKLTPNAAVGDTIGYDIFYQNTGGITATDLRLLDEIPAGTSFVSASYLDEERSPRGIDPGRGESDIEHPATGSTTGTVIYHLGRVPPGESGFVRLFLKVEEGALSQKGLEIQNEPAVATSSFAHAARAAVSSRQPVNAALVESVFVTGKSISRLLDQNVPRLFVTLTAPMAVKEGETFDYLVSVANPTNGPVVGTAIKVIIPSGAEFVSASQDNAFEGPDPQGRAVIFPNQDNAGTRQDIPAHAALLRKVTLRATSGNAGKTLRSAGASTLSTLAIFPGGTGFVEVAPFYSGNVASYVYGGDQLFGSVKMQVAQASLAAQGVETSALVDKPSFQARVASLTSSATYTATGGADTVPLNNGDVVIPLGNGRIVATGGGNFLNASGLIGQDGASIVAQGGGNIVAQGGGNLIKVTNLISNDGGSLISQDGASIQSILSGIVAQGAGNIVAQGGGNIVAQGGGNLISNDGGSLISNDGGSLTPINVSALVGNSGGTIVAAGAGNIISTGGTNLLSSASNIVAAGAGNIVAAGAGNIVAAGGGNIVAAGAGNLHSADVAGGAFLTAGGIVAQGGGNIVAAGAGNFSGAIKKPSARPGVIVSLPDESEPRPRPLPNRGPGVLSRVQEN